MLPSGGDGFSIQVSEELPFQYFSNGIGLVKISDCASEDFIIYYKSLNHKLACK